MRMFGAALNVSVAVLDLDLDLDVDFDSHDQLFHCACGDCSESQFAAFAKAHVKATLMATAMVSRMAAKMAQIWPLKEPCEHAHHN